MLCPALNHDPSSYKFLNDGGADQGFRINQSRGCLRSEETYFVDSENLHLKLWRVEGGGIEEMEGDNDFIYNKNNNNKKPIMMIRKNKF